MNWRSYTKRLLALILAVVMVVGLIPATVFAANNDVDYLFLATDRHTNTSIIGTMINAMEAKIGENELDYLALGGDMVGSGGSHPSYNSSTVLKEVTSATSSLSAANVDIVAGIHDMNANDDAGIVLPYSGGGAQIFEGNKFYVYGVPESCISGAVSGVDPETEANDFVTWASNVADKSKAIIVVSHYPLHQRRNDNDGAVYWASALNTVAAGDDTTIDRNVAFFWGHNHTGESSADTAVYHVAPNGSISVQGGSSNQTIYFTYANAGYLNSHSSATLITITDDTITFDKYKNSSVSTSYSVDRVQTTPAVTLSSIAISGTTEYTVGDELNLIVTATYSDNSNKEVTADATLTGYDMSTAGTYTVTATYEGKTATATITVSQPATATSIDVTGETEYTVGDVLDLSVTATYDDGSTKTVTEVTTFSGCDLTASGTYTITATYGTLTDTIDVTVAVYDEDAAGMAVEAVSQGATALTITWDDAAETVLTDGNVYSDFVVYDLALTDYTAGNPVTYTMYLYEDMDATNLMVYHVAEDGTLTEVAYKIEGDCVVFTTDLTGTFAYGALTVPAGYALEYITVTSEDGSTYKNYFVDDVPYAGDFVVTAVYTKEGAKDFTRVLQVYEANNNPDGYEIDLGSFDMTTSGSYNMAFTYGGLSATFPIRVWGHDFTASDVTVHVDGSEYGVTNVNVATSTNANVADAIQYVITGNNYVAYDITLAYANGYSETEDAKTVTLPIPEGVTNPVVYYVSDSGKSVVDMGAEITEDGKHVTFTTTHFSTYVLGDGTTIETGNQGATVEGTDDITNVTKDAEEYTVYKLVTKPEIGKQYLIVNSANGAGYGLDGDTTGYSTTAFTGGSDYYSTWDDASKTGTAFAAGNDVYLTTSNAYEWTVGGSASAYTFNNDGTYLRLTYTPESSNGCGGTTAASYELDFGDSDTWVYIGGTLQNDSHDTYYLNVSDDTWSVATTGSNVYFYEPVTIYKVTEETNTIPGTEGGTYTAAGTDITDAIAISGVTATLSSSLTFTTEDNATSTPSGWTATYELTEKGNPNVITSISGNVATLSGVAGTAVVKVTYTSADGTLTAWDEFIVTATAPDRYSIQLHEKNGDTYGDEITAPVALKGVKAGDTYSVWAVVKAYASADDTTGIDLGTLGNALSWTVSDESIATIDKNTGVITFTGNNYGTFDVTVAYEGADGKVITDTITISATKTSYVVPGDGTNDFPEYPNEGAVRFDKTATAVGNYSETGLALVELSMTGVPYTTGNELDVVLMLDMTGSMDDVSSSTSKPTGYVRIDATIAASKAFIETIVKNEDGSYNDNRVGVYVFNKNGAATLYDFGAVDSDTELEAIYADLETIKDDHFASGGTPYDDGLAKCQSVLASAKTDGIGNDRQQFCVFMTDGVPTSYAYVNGTSMGTHSSASAVAGMLTSASDYATRDTDYKYEYYSTEMKKDGVTVYSVGVGLFNENNAWSGSATQCGNLASALLNDISGPGGETTQPDAAGTSTLSKKDSYFFSVDDADAGTEMAKIFKNIAVQILEAAKDVVVEDKIGSDYTVNFKLPGDVTSEDAGMSEFYIQAVEYQLDADKNRTGDPTVLENFTFNADGTLKSHTVDGVACTDCSHVTFTDGVVTGITGTYFQYTSETKVVDGETITEEFLHWEADKLTTTELALQYFAYLDNSAGLTNDQIESGLEKEPGTYYTNEYATLTYTNYNGKEVQQEFPVPQMTWNGAQVYYLFYLVNENGQPVNRAGRVVPFAEAVYVTDVYEKIITWNDEEQTESLDAEILAERLVPEVYELYDTGANYTIHVFEDEEGANLNNHFLLESGFTSSTTSPYYVDKDGDGKADELAYTTYVFNTKADATKYTVPGYYAETETFKCKVYAEDGQYTDELGKYNIEEMTGANTVKEGFDFANTTVAFAVVWKPELVEDTVVVDYGLDVVIDVITNDGMAAGVKEVQTTQPNAVINSGTYERDEELTTSVDVYIDANSDQDGLKELKIGTATVENLNAIRFSLDKTNGMQFNKPATFYYEADVNFYDDAGELQTTSMYSSVTVIPATTVYYEDTFVTFSDNWSVEGTTSNKTQDVDRPGTKTISEAYDANNVYGYDSAYETMSTYSLGSAHKVHVDANSYGTATFSFYGTGFDVISMTSNTTGTITVKVTDANGAKVEAKVVNTYYGYTKNEDGSWTATPDTAVALYQVPVMQVNGLAYGQYTVTITATWAAALDKTTADGYDLYLDAIRIYDPIGVASNSVTNDVVSNAYKDDGEGWPTYMELRNQLLTAKDFEASLDSTVLTGAMFIDGISALGEAQIADYTSYGPNNEVYLAPGQGVAFTLTNADRVHVGMRRMTGTATYTIESYDEDGKLIKSVTGDVTSATDMYYDITDLKDGTIVIRNSGTSGELMLTNLKYTFESNPASAQVAMFMTMRRSAMVLSALNTVEESTETEDTVTDGNTNTGNTTGDNTNTEVEDTVTEPEVDVTEPEVDPTEPETDKPAEDIPEEEIPEVTPPAEEPSVQQNFWTGLWNAIKSAFSRLFGWAGI